MHPSTAPAVLHYAAGVVLCSLLLTACGDASRERAWAGTIDTLPGGIVRVSNPETGVWGEGQGWRVVEELRIGSAMDDGPAMFGNVIAIEADEDGRIYVADAHAQEIRVFGADGAHLFSFGRKGAGPGEFESIGGMGWGPDGHLWVMDQRNSRFAVFDRTGAHMTDHRRPGGFMMMPWPGGFDRQGRIYDVGIPARADGPFRAALIRYHFLGDAGIEPRDTFVIPRYDTEGFTLRDSEGRLRIMASIPFAPGLVWRLNDGHVWTGISDAYRFHRLDFTGDTVRIVERDFTPPVVAAAEKDSAIAAMEWFTDQGGRVDRSRIPDRKPAFRVLLEDDRGYVWVIPHVARGDDPAADIFDPDGRYLGRVALPEPVPLSLPPVIRGDLLFTVVHDDLDIPYVARYRVEGRGEGRMAGR